MAEEWLRSHLGVEGKTIKRACHLAMEAHKDPQKPFIVKRKCFSSKIIFAFPGTWSTGDWFYRGTSTKQYGETKVNLEVFPSIGSIGNAEIASVNDAFLRRFLSIMEKPALHNEVDKALKRKKQIIFTGHSGGGPIAICATVWLFEYLKKGKIKTTLPLCLTFGSPLMADRIFCHALRREKWSDSFINFATRYDIIPRIMLATPFHIEQMLPEILSSFSKNINESTPLSMEGSGFIKTMFENVMINASTVANQAACILMGSTNQLVDTITSFTELSPYRPFGTYVFCYGKGKLLAAKNPDAVLQLLIYSAQLSTHEELPEIAQASLSEHLAYKIKLEVSENQGVYYSEKFRELPQNSEECADGEAQIINTALDDFDLSVRARLCLLAAREAENQKMANQRKIDDRRDSMEKTMKELEVYRASCETRGVGYYDSFKLQTYEEDFLANVKRLELGGKWDEIIEMLKRNQLPDGFEGDKTWVQLGTRYRRLVEPLDIANYYRNALYKDTERYMKAGSRPKRYRYTQRWHEHYKQIPRCSSGESTFWAEVEQFRITMTDKNTPFDDVKKSILELEKNLKRWHDKGEVKKDAFLPESTLVQWWKTLPEEHRAASPIKDLTSS